MIPILGLDHDAGESERAHELMGHHHKQCLAFGCQKAYLSSLPTSEFLP